jgi:hypothetical protein
MLQRLKIGWCRPFVITGIAVTLAGLPNPVHAQNPDNGRSSNPTTTNPTSTNPTSTNPATGTSSSATSTTGASTSATATGSADFSQARISQDETRNLDQFLDAHPEITRQLQSDPGLVNDPEYLRATPDLREYLDQHPELQNALRSDADLIRRQDLNQQQARNNFQDQSQPRNDDQAQARDNNNDRNGAGQQNDNRVADDDANRRQQDSAKIDQFLDDHPNIAKDLKNKPPLVNDDGYLKKHGELATFLRDNPDVRDECGRNPAYFEDRDLRAQMIRTDFNNGYRPDAMRPDARENAELAQFNRFLDSHREIAEQLRKDPSLADNREFLQNHQALGSFLQDNPGVRDQLSHDPRAFMNQEDRFDRFANNPDRDRMMDFHQFLGQHPRIATDVSKDPTLVKNHDYMQRNPELATYLSQHPDVRDAWSANPQSFVDGAKQMSTTSNATSGSGVTTGAGVSSHAGAGTGMSNGSTNSTSPTAPASPSKTK